MNFRQSKTLFTFKSLLVRTELAETITSCNQKSLDSEGIKRDQGLFSVKRSLFLPLSLSFFFQLLEHAKRFWEISLTFSKFKGGFFHLKTWGSGFKLQAFGSLTSMLQKKRELSFLLNLIRRSRHVGEEFGFYNFNFMWSCV